MCRLEKLFKDLEANAYNFDNNHYFVKEANQIIRKHFEKENPKVYLCGKISGKEEDAKIEFEAAEERLTELGYNVINPFKLAHKSNATWQDYMKVDIQAMLNCKFINIVNDITTSKGAKIESKLAKKLGIKRINPII